MGGNYRGMDTNFALGYEQNLPASDPASILSRHVDMPDPAPHDLIVEVRAVSVNPVDVKLRTGAPSEGFRVLGFDAAGVVVAVGSEVTLFSPPGDEVFYAGRSTAPPEPTNASTPSMSASSDASRRHCRSPKLLHFRSPRSPRGRRCSTGSA